MSKDIWHTTKEKPMLHRDIILCGDGWSMPMDIIPETVDNICWKNVEKWCYVDDLIKENDRTRKALELATERLQQIAHESFQGDQQSINMGFHIRAAAALTDIEQITAPEQKEQ